MGASLCLRLAADRGEELAGLVLVNAAVDTLRKDAVLLPFLKRVVPAFPGIRNDIKKPGMDEVAYPVLPLKAAYEMSRGWAELRRDLPKVTVPVLFFRSSEDHVADISSSRALNAGLSSKDFEERVLENSYHVAYPRQRRPAHLRRVCRVHRAGHRASSRDSLGPCSIGS